MVAYEPDPIQKDDCGTYKVRNKIVTAYVLKPPPPPPAIRTECTVVREACLSSRPESDTQPELTNTDETQKKPRHRRHHRVRRYWR